MKKIVLLSLMVLPLLTGCNLKDPQFSLVDWLSNIEEGTQTFFDMNIYDMNEYKGKNWGYSDYEYKLANVIIENSSSMKHTWTSSIVDTNRNHIRYIMRRDMDDFFELQILVFEDLLSMHAAGYDKNKEYITEVTQYSIPKENGKKIIEETTKWWDEMGELSDKSYLDVYNQTTPETFYSFIEGSTTEPSIIYKKKETKDTNLALLEEFKNFAYIELEDNYFIEGESVTYGIENEYTLTIGRGYLKKPIAQLIHYYDNPAVNFGSYERRDEVKVTYSISEEKYNAFMDKVKAM